MDCQEIRRDLRATVARRALHRELLGDRLGEGSIIAPPGAQVGHQV